MICTNNMRKFRLLCILCIAAVFLTACGKKITITDAYPVYSNAYMAENSSVQYDARFFSEGLCVTGTADFGTEQVSAYTAAASGAFNVDKCDVVYANQIYEQIYPASLTKILTALIIIENCNLDDSVTVSDHAVDLEAEASTCGLSAGDVTTVKNLLYGLLLASGNDAAIALAEYYSGSVEAFAEVMNQQAQALGATNSHFLNPSGLHEENHYTTVYDLYLIFQKCIQSDVFVEIISTKSIDVSYTNIRGESVNQTYENTNRYLSGSVDSPNGFTIIGGKTGTTDAAGNCLILLSENSSGERIISIVAKAESKSDLYILMSQILSAFCS